MYEREPNWAGRAHAIIRERICALPEFARARSLVVMGALDECRGRDVAGMRELGGFSEVIRRHIAALPDAYRVDYGSKFFPRTVADILRDFVPAMREELQSTLARVAQ